MIDSFKRVLQPGQLVLNDVPPSLHSEHRSSMSPVVQQLENMAVSHQPHRTASTSTSQSFPPPPPQPTNGTPTSPPATQQTFAPVAYNPAAPAAPEQRVHREKTPPPPDADSGTGLNGAAQHEQPGYHGGSGPQQGGFGPQSTPYMPGPPGAHPQPGIHRTSTMGSLGSIPPPPQSASPYQQSFAGPPQVPTPQQDPNAHLYAQQPGTPGIQRQSTYPYQSGQPATSGAPTPTQYANYPSAVPNAQGPTSPAPGHQQTYAPLQSPGFAPQQTSSPYGAQQPAAQQPNQGYGQYNPSSTTHAMHSQFYTPEGSSTPAIPGQGSQGGNGKVDPGRLDATVGRLEKRVGGFLKRLDKKL